MKQVTFGFLRDFKKEFGGSLIEGKRKTLRPLSTKHPIHLDLKTSHTGLFNPGNRSLEKLIRTQAKKFNVKVYELALNWTHIHFLISIKDRQNYNRFIRSLTSKMAIKIRQIRPHLKEVFSLRPFTRIVTWGRDFKRVLTYQILNQLEALGLVHRPKSKHKRKKITGNYPNARSN